MRLSNINKVNVHDFIGQIFAQSDNLYITHSLTHSLTIIASIGEKNDASAYVV